MIRKALDLELDILDWTSGQLSVAGRKVQGHPRLSPELPARLRELESNPQEYGRVLFEALLPIGDPMRTCYRKALDEARRTEKFLRFKLTLSLSSAGPLHRLRWECLYDSEQKAAVARSPETAFSRYAPIGKEDAAPTLEQLPRLLVAVAAPTDSEQHGMTPIDRAEMQRQLDFALQPLKGQMEWDFVTAPVTLGRLRRQLYGERYHALHLVAHGYVDLDLETSVLVLEKSDGLSDMVAEEDLPEVFLGDRSLRLLTLVTCQGGVQSLDEPLSGLGRRLVARGLPAVISMQDSVTFVTAEEFSKHFYLSLARSGSVDAAVNETRHQLYLLDRRSPRWSDPVLFMRLEDGAIWRRTEESAEEPSRRASPRPRRSWPAGMQVNNDRSVIFRQENRFGPQSDADKEQS